MQSLASPAVLALLRHHIKMPPPPPALHKCGCVYSPSGADADASAIALWKYRAAAAL
jgi:hypothetical protein